MAKVILITGPPGIGKTTLIKNIANSLHQQKCDISGFYTEEVRDERNNRIGFDIITLDNRRSMLARKLSDQPSKYRVGNYAVNIEEFERLAIPALEKPSGLLIIDEIGKMELFSKKFQSVLTKLIKEESLTVLASVPTRCNIDFVNCLKSNNKLIEVNRQNRDQLKDVIVATLK